MPVINMIGYLTEMLVAIIFGDFEKISQFSKDLIGDIIGRKWVGSIFFSFGDHKCW